jgi:hypothetical protein
VTDTLSYRITAAIRHHHEGMNVAMLMDVLNYAARSSLISATCHSLAKRGFLVKEERPMPGTRRLVAWFRPSPALLRGEVRHSAGHTPRAEPIRQFLESDGPQTLDTITARTGMSRRAAHGALMAMIAGGEVERLGPANQQRYGLVTDEDEPWSPPVNYISAARAWALGLKRAA